MKAYSMDLRQRVFAAVQEGKLSHDEIAQRFSCCTSWIRRLVQRHRETGSLEPRTSRGCPPRKLQETHLHRLRELVQTKSDSTLEELRQQLGEPVSVMTICRALKKLKLPLKKKRNERPNKNGLT